MALATVTFFAYLPVEQPQQAPFQLSTYQPPPRKDPPQGGRRRLTEQPPMLLAMGQSTHPQFEG